jgi:hypothetical protein
MQAGMEFAPVAAVPGFLGLIGAIDEDGLGIPIGPAARQIAAAFQQQDALAGRRQSLRQGRAAGAAANHNEIECFRAGHGAVYPPVAKPGKSVMPPSTNKVVPTT